MSKESVTKNLKYMSKGKQTNINIRQFDLKMMRDEAIKSKECSILMIAKKSSGKSWICRSILYYFRDIPVISIIAPTERLDPFYSRFVPDSYIHYAYKSKYLKKLFERQELMIEKAEKYKRLGKHISVSSILLMDDCLASRRIWEKDDQIIEMMYNGRHYHVMFMLTIQKILGIDPSLRSNFDIIFILKCEFVSDYKKIYEHYAGMFQTLDVFKKVFKEITKNFGAMVLIYKGKTDKLSDKVMWYRSGEISGGYVGCEQYINNHKLNFNPDWKKGKHIASIGLEELDKNNIGNIGIAKENDDNEDDD